MKTVSCKEVLKTQDSPLQTIEHELRTTGPKLLPLLAMRCLYQGVHLTNMMTYVVSQPGSCNWPANKPCGRISTYQALGWSDIWWQQEQEPNHIGPQYSHWFPLGSDLPDQGQASDRNELYSFLYTFQTTFSDHLQFCIYAV